MVPVKNSFRSPHRVRFLAENCTVLGEGFFMPTNLYTTVPYKGRPSFSDCELLIKKAEKEHSWECLKPYPSLLLFYQSRHTDCVLPIARWVSHFRMPFMKPDFKTTTITVKDKTMTFSMGTKEYGHKLCKPNCGSVDYVTGVKVEQELL